MKNRIHYYLSVYQYFFKLDIKRISIYPIDFVLGNLGFLIDTLSNLFVLYIIMSTTSTLGEFNGYQMLFYYSFIMLSGAFFEIFFVTILELPYMIHTGELDIFLIRPLNLLFQFIIFQVDEESIFEAIFATGLLIFSMTQLSNTWNLLFLAKLILYLISSVLIRYSIYLFLSSLTFWWVSNEGLKSIFWEISQLSNYPLSIYPQIIKLLLIIIPFSFVGYFPVKDLLLNDSSLSISTFVNTFSGVIVLFLVYSTVWKWGLKKYRSAGG